MRHLLSILLAVCLLAAAPSCALLNRTAASAEEAADALRDAASALELLDALVIGYADGSVMPTPDELNSLADVVENLKIAHDSLAIARAEIRSGHVFEAAEALDNSLGHMEHAAAGLVDLGVDISEASEALRQARLMLQHLRS